jgi:hypothetical protein
MAVSTLLRLQAKDSYAWSAEGGDRGQRALGAVTNRMWIAFQGISLAYPPGALILKGFPSSWRVESGRMRFELGQSG